MKLDQRSYVCMDVMYVCMYVCMYQVCICLDVCICILRTYTCICLYMFHVYWAYIQRYVVVETSPKLLEPVLPPALVGPACANRAGGRFAWKSCWVLVQTGKSLELKSFACANRPRNALNQNRLPVSQSPRCKKEHGA